MSRLTTPRDLLILELKKLHRAESQLAKALPQLAISAHHPDLRQAFETHLGETEHQLERLERILQEEFQENTRGGRGDAIDGLLDEAEETMDQSGEAMVHDLALIGAAQKIEHYEIAAYGMACTVAELAGEGSVAQILQKSLEEESATAKLLATIAAHVAAQPAASGGGAD